jgi:hypothetical protein
MAALEVVGEQPLPEAVLVPVPQLQWAAAVGVVAMPLSKAELRF